MDNLTALPSAVPKTILKKKKKKKGGEEEINK